MEPIKLNKMWPFPAHPVTEKWIREVREVNEVTEEPTLDAKNQIALLQNEYIYQLQLAQTSPVEVTKSAAAASANLIKSALESKGAKALNSLDVRDATQVPQAPNGNIIPVMAGDVRVSPEFQALGPDNMYQVGNLIWSAVAG